MLVAFQIGLIKIAKKNVFLRLKIFQRKENEKIR